jgi:hypothetical protein
MSGFDSGSQRFSFGVKSYRTPTKTSVCTPLCAMGLWVISRERSVPVRPPSRLQLSSSE